MEGPKYRIAEQTRQITIELRDHVANAMEDSVANILCNVTEDGSHRKAVLDLMKEYLNMSYTAQFIFSTVLGYDGIMELMDSFA